MTNAPLTDDQLRGLLELESKATPGEWRAARYDQHSSHLRYVADDVYLLSSDDFEFCAPARNNLRAIVEELLEHREDVRATHAHYCTEAWTGRGKHAPECEMGSYPHLEEKP